MKELVDADDVFPRDVLKNFKTYTVRNSYPITNKVVYRKMLWKGIKDREMRTNGQFFNLDEMIELLSYEIDELKKIELKTNRITVQIKSKTRYIEYMIQYKEKGKIDESN